MYPRTIFASQIFQNFKNKSNLIDTFFDIRLIQKIQEKNISLNWNIILKTFALNYLNKLV